MRRVVERRKIMKKIVTIFMAVTIALCFAACGNGAEKPSNETVSDSSEQTAGQEDGNQQPELTEENREEQQADPNEEQDVVSEETVHDGEDTENASKALVVYFSATGNTKAVAETIARLQDADIYEIVPEQPYTEEDLDYNDGSTRATAEQNDPEARPVISGSIEDMDRYDVIYVGYPIWWGDMPRILYTFFDTYDLTGKTIVPFCTSGGSGLSGTPGTIGGLEEGAEVLEGLHISDSSVDSAEDTVSEWLNRIGQVK